MHDAQCISSPSGHQVLPLVLVLRWFRNLCGEPQRGIARCAPNSHRSPALEKFQQCRGVLDLVSKLLAALDGDGTNVQPYHLSLNEAVDWRHGFFVYLFWEGPIIQEIGYCL